MVATRGDNRETDALGRQCAFVWPCYCRGDEPPSDRWVDAGAAAAHHILDVAGCTPILDEDVLCALWCRGGGDRALAQNLYDLVGGQR
jgi:hypothetical protein